MADDPRFAIGFEAVTKAFADQAKIFDGLTLDIPHGQFCVILGASGAGKSTLLRLVNGLVTPDAGSVRVDGTAVDRRSLPRLRPRIGMIHQSFDLVPRASVAVNIATGALPALPLWRGLIGVFPARVKAGVEALVNEVGLRPDQLRRRADSLSGGEQQRVGIARACIGDPAIILADEPVASLDPRIANDIMQLIADAARIRGSTVLCSLHQIDLARAFADRIVALRTGRIVFDGPPGALDRDAIAAIYGDDLGPRRVAA